MDYSTLELATIVGHRHKRNKEVIDFESLHCSVKYFGIIVTIMGVAYYGGLYLINNCGVL